MRKRRFLIATTICGTLLVAGAVAVRASGEQSATLRAADAGVSPGFCPALRALLDAAPEGFIALRGASRGGGESVWEGSRRPPGASDCVILGGAPPAYVCTLYAGDAEKNADGAYDGAVSCVKDCLPAGWKTTEKVDGVHTRTTFAAGAPGPSIRVVSRDAMGDAYLVELWVDAAGGERRRR
jgi:hypothetical protein